MSDVRVPTLTPPSQFTAATEGEFEAAVAPHSEIGPPGLVVDLDAVAFISSSGLGQLVHLGHRLGARGAVVALAGGRRSVVKLIQTVGLDVMLPLFPNVEDAQAFLCAKHEAGE